ncbi:MAG: flippase-like domain-containing protein [Deltaproteobacteria bacterium]|nr:flippase-like domain-containing protein [Deltaproteobacteria bacterium]MBW2071188.1 flippase-like domain-containing protein [Deltaproteobacteria bacterium]
MTLPTTTDIIDVRNWNTLIRIGIAAILFLAASIYIAQFLPSFDLNIFALVSLNKWSLILCLFLLVQLLTIYYFNLIISKMAPVKSLFRLCQVMFASYSVNYAGPLKLGMPLRIYLFKRILAIPYPAGTASVVLTTGLDVFVMAVIIVTLSGAIYFSASLGLILGSVVIICFAMLVALSRQLSSLCPGRPAWLANFLSYLGKLSLLSMLAAILISAIKTLLLPLTAWVVLHALGTTVNMAEMTFVYCASHLAGLLSFVPMGIGIKDASLIGLLGRLDTPASVCVAFVAIDRLVWSAIPLCLGLLAAWHLGINEVLKSAKSELKPDRL